MKLRQLLEGDLELTYKGVHATWFQDSEDFWWINYEPSLPKDIDSRHNKCSREGQCEEKAKKGIDEYVARKGGKVTEAKGDKMSDIKDLVNPHPSDMAKIKAALKRAGVSIMSDTKDAEVIEQLRDIFGDFVARLKKMKLDQLPLAYHGDHGYSYIIASADPLKVVASDGGEVKECKYLSDLFEWSPDFIEDVLEVADAGDSAYARKKFSVSRPDQDEHETMKRRGDA